MFHDAWKEIKVVCSLIFDEPCAVVLDLSVIFTTVQCSAHQCARARGCIFDDEVICNLFPWVWSIIYKIHHHLYSWFVLVWLAFAQFLLFSGLRRPLLQMYNGAFCQKIVHKMKVFFPNEIRKRADFAFMVDQQIYSKFIKECCMK